MKALLDVLVNDAGVSNRVAQEVDDRATCC